MDASSRPGAREVGRRGGPRILLVVVVGFLR